MIYVVLWYYLYGFMWLYGLCASRGVATAKEATGKSMYVRVMERKKVRRNDPIEYFLPTGVRITV